MKIDKWLGKQVSGVSVFHESKVTGTLCKWTEPLDSLSTECYFVATNVGTDEERHIAVFEKSIELFPEKSEAAENFLVFDEKEAKLLRDSIHNSIPVWQLRGYITHVIEILGSQEAAIAFLSKLEFVKED